MANIMATDAEIILKAGSNYPSTLGDATAIGKYGLQAESYINVVTGYNWSDAYAALNVDIKYILTEIVTNLVAIYLWNAKPTGEDGTTSRIEYEDRVNILFARFVQCMDILTDLGTEKFMTNA